MNNDLLRKIQITIDAIEETEKEIEDFEKYFETFFEYGFEPYINITNRKDEVIFKIPLEKFNDNYSTVIDNYLSETLDNNRKIKSKLEKDLKKLVKGI